MNLPSTRLFANGKFLSVGQDFAPFVFHKNSHRRYFFVQDIGTFLREGSRGRSGVVGGGYSLYMVELSISICSKVFNSILVG